MTGIRDRVAIVTGGTRGIGLGITKAFVAEGAKVVAVYRSDDRAAAAAGAELEGLEGEAAFLKADVGIVAETVRVTGFTLAKWGRIDFLVNNAGIFDFAYLDEMDEEFFDRIYTANLKGVVFMMKAVLPVMKERRFGRIVNASSISGRFADAGLIAYGCSKAGVDMTTRIASAELGPYGITVNAFAPGIIDTDMTRPMIRERGHLQVKQVPIGSFGTAEDVSGLILFLCSAEAGYITGEVIGVDGGMMKVQNPYRAIERAEQAGRHEEEK